MMPLGSCAVRSHRWLMAMRLSFGILLAADRYSERERFYVLDRMHPMGQGQIGGGVFWRRCDIRFYKILGLGGWLIRGAEQVADPSEDMQYSAASQKLMEQASRNESEHLDRKSVDILRQASIWPRAEKHVRGCCCGQRILLAHVCEITLSEDCRDSDDDGDDVSLNTDCGDLHGCPGVVSTALQLGSCAMQWQRL